MNWRGTLETLVITLTALVLSAVLFALFIWAVKDVPPIELFKAVYAGGFGSLRPWMTTLTKAAPLILAALCTALPARLGLVIIGGEGALIAGGLVAAIVGLSLAALPFPLPQVIMAVCGMTAGALLIGLAGFLHFRRGVNATISSLLLTYIVLGVFNYLVEGPLRDPKSLNKPSTVQLAATVLIGKMPYFTSVHWGLVYGVVACFLAWVLMDRTTFGFAARMAGGNVKAAQAAGLPVGRLILLTCLMGGAAAGLAGVVEVAAVNKQANASLYVARYGYTGILVSFIARHHALGILPVAVLFGGLKAASYTLQIRLNLPDASVDIFAGIVFILILLFETLHGRIKLFQPRETREPAPAAPETAKAGAAA